MNYALRADCIGKAFKERKVLTSATLRAKPGEVTALLGRNGCGKSTLLKVSTGALEADSGTVFYRDKAHERVRWHKLAKDGLFFLPDRDLLSSHVTIEWHLKSVVRQFGMPHWGEAAAICGIEPLLHKGSDTLSTGERRRAEIAVALARRPVCLLADEPYRNIDPRDREVIRGALREMAKLGCAVVVTGHEIADLFADADQVVWCTDGTTYELGQPETARQHWRFSTTYLGSSNTTLDR